MEREYLNLIGGKWGPATGGATTSDRNPARTDEVRRRLPLRGREDAARAAEAAAKAFPGWARTPMPKRGEILLQGGRPLRAAAGRGRGGPHAGRRQDPGREQGRDGARRQPPPLLRGRGAAAHRRRVRLGLPGHVPLCGARAPRTGGPHHALELPGRHPHLEGRARPGLRQHRRAQAGRADAADRLAPGGRAGQGRACLRASSTWWWAAARRSGRPWWRARTSRPSASRARTRSVAAGRAVRGAGDQVPARDGRQEPGDGAERRRPGQGGGAHDRGGDAVHRAEVHGHQPRDRPPRRPRRASATGWSPGRPR